MSKVYISLEHGRTNPNEDMQNKKGVQGPVFGPFDNLTMIYNSWIKDDKGNMLQWYKDMIYYDGVYYGELVILPELPEGRTACQIEEGIYKCDGCGLLIKDDHVAGRTGEGEICCPNCDGILFYTYVESGEMYRANENHCYNHYLVTLMSDGCADYPEDIYHTLDEAIAAAKIMVDCPADQAEYAATSQFTSYVFAPDQWQKQKEDQSRDFDIIVDHIDGVMISRI